MAQTVFLIHDIKDKPFARQMASELSLAGATVWLDEAEIGDTQNSLINDVLKDIFGHVYLAVILSPNSAGSDWLRSKVEFLLKQQVPGFTITVLPLVIKNCTVPLFLADKRFADFRNPSGFTTMLRKVIKFLGLESAGAGPLLPSDITGMWQGSWVWGGRKRDANLFLSSWPTIPSRMIIRYLKSGVLTIVEQEFDVLSSGNVVKLIGTSYRLLERGISLGWILDRFNLSIGESCKTLEGIITDKKGIQSSLLFMRT
jgi:hypothetical protein